jgi:hypothetical protein
LLARLLHVGAITWRLAKWSAAAGTVLLLLEWLTRGADARWSAAPWLVAGVVLLFLWERYGLGHTALACGRIARWIAMGVLALLGGTGAWLAAHLLATLLRALA